MFISIITIMSFIAYHQYICLLRSHMHEYGFSQHFLLYKVAATLLAHPSIHKLQCSTYSTNRARSHFSFPSLLSLCIPFRFVVQSVRECFSVVLMCASFVRSSCDSSLNKSCQTGTVRLERPHTVGTVAPSSFVNKSVNIFNINKIQNYLSVGRTSRNSSSSRSRQLRIRRKKQRTAEWERSREWENKNKVKEFYLDFCRSILNWTFVYLLNIKQVLAFGQNNKPPPPQRKGYEAKESHILGVSFRKQTHEEDSS